ncbi:MAG TPA: hypothetical protein VMV10_11970 [Pirellulales bacterium]|nr:hypothetical protein [Pirellulales bacterium]
MATPVLPAAELPPPPRRVRVRRCGEILASCCFSLLFLPLAGVGLVLLGTAASISALWVGGAERAGKVLECDVVGDRLTIEYALRDGTLPLANQMTVDADEYPNLKPGDEIVLRAITIASRTLAMPAANVTAKRVLATWLLAAIWNVFVAFFYYALWQDFYWEWRLVARGAAVIDQIRDKQVPRGAFSTAYVVYFPTPAGLVSMQTSAKLYAALPKQSVVTILYDPRKPARAIVYELSRFKAAGDRRPLAAARNEEDLA